MYKSTVKKQIKDWQSLVIQRKNQEWLIVLVTKPDPTGKAAKGTTASSGGGGLFGFGGSVLDKIRSDFNIGKRDRCAPPVSLVSAPGADCVSSSLHSDASSSGDLPSRIRTSQASGRSSSPR